jgi:hypothetical protein
MGGTRYGTRLTKNRHRIDFRIALIAALALIVAQMGAMAHAYTHVPKVSQTSIQIPSPTDHQVCGECLNFAPLLAAAGAPTIPVFIEAPARGPVATAQPASRLSARPLLAFRSRAPPATR